MDIQSEDHIQVRIFRFNPLYDKAPYYQNYQIPATEPVTILSILTHIYQYLDRSLAFRNYTCYRGTCLSCLVKADGRTVRACSTLIQPGNKVTLDPFRKNQIICDLVVDLGKEIRK
jgi:succinate dehydrogenase/fumarate reductase-like Fe-S protein